MEDALLTVQEVADLLKLNQQTIRNWIDRGELGAVRLGPRRVRIRQSEPDRFIAAGESKATIIEAETVGDSAEGESEQNADPMAELWERLDRAVSGMGAARTGDQRALASALSSLADAAGTLADALSERPVE